MAIVIRQCECCGKPMLAKRSTKRFCSKNCHQITARNAERQRKKLEEAALIQRFKLETLGTDYGNQNDLGDTA